MARGCEWPTRCEDDGIPEGVPVFNLEWEGALIGVYCRIHAMRRVRQLEMGSRRRPGQGADAGGGEESSA